MISDEFKDEFTDLLEQYFRYSVQWIKLNDMKDLTPAQRIEKARLENPMNELVREMQDLSKTIEPKRRDPEPRHENS